MAEKDELNLAAETGKPKGGALKLVLIILATGALAGAVAGGVAYFLVAGKPAATATETTVARTPLIYRALEPELVTNIDGPGRIRFVQVGLVMSARDPKVIEALDRHAPVIRNDLILLLSGKTHEQLTTVEGKERTRSEMLEAIRNVLADRTGNPGVESIYFTSFVMQ